VKKFLREPLLHFLLLGAAIFLAYGLLPKQTADEPARIVVTRGEIASIILGFTRTWQRAPTHEELQDLIRDRVREEVYYREALALGLDKDDTIVRRRLRQKLEFLTEDTAAQVQPTEQELAAYLETHGERFRSQRRWSFSQVYLNPQKHGENLVEDAVRLRARLRQAGSNADTSVEGDFFLLGHDFTDLPASEVAKLFGETFAGELARLAPGEWLGPIGSGYGLHVVFVSDIREGGIPGLADVREAVIREWADTRRREANEKRYAEMLKGYLVVVEPAQVADPERADTKPR
jgi:hypothetical protein